MSRAITSEHFLLLALPDEPVSALFWYGTGMFRAASDDGVLMNQHILACNAFCQFWKHPDFVPIAPLSQGNLHKWARPDQKASYILPLVEQEVPGALCLPERLRVPDLLVALPCDLDSAIIHNAGRDIQMRRGADCC